uniref:Uncharacterized protein n=1 Tax=Romanomermis culicivorax TaxID=13658 RepID=A0A915KUR9_ROMCU
MNDNHNRSDYPSICRSLKVELQSALWPYQQAFLLFLCPISLSANLAAIYYLIRNGLFNKNFKLLLGSLNFSNSMLSGATFAYSARILHSYVSDPCGLIVLNLDCTKTYLPIGIPLMAMPLVLVALSIERLSASVFYKQYGGLKGMAFPAFLFALASIVLLFQILTLFENSGVSSTTAQFLKICHDMILPNTYIQSLRFFTVVSQQLIALVIFIFVYIWDKKYYALTLNQACNRLKIRYQLMFNIQINKAMLPSTLVCLPCFLIANLCIIATSSADMPDNQKTVYSNFFLVSFNVYVFLQPVILFSCNKWFKNALKSDFFRLVSTMGCKMQMMTNHVGPSESDHKRQDVTKKYFAELDQMWS